ncbi:MAG: S8 family serine peptidase [Deltaproteobacteria bacterium]
MSALHPLSISERLDAHPDFDGTGVCIAFADSGFYPHPDLMRPQRRIRSYVDVTRPEPVPSEFFSANTHSWHGTMTACCATGSGHLSSGRYRGLAHGAEVVLIKVASRGEIRGKYLASALRVPLRYPRLGIQVINVSIGVERDDPHHEDVIAAVREVTAAGVVIVAAAGNAPGRSPGLPAASEEVIAVGGEDDNNTRAGDDDSPWPSSHGQGLGITYKPELIAPSVWLAAPVLPGTLVAREADALFSLRALLDEAAVAMHWLDPSLVDADEKASVLATVEAIDARIARGRFINTHYQRVQGTSFAAPITSSVVVQMLQANPTLTPAQVREGLIATARRLHDVPSEVQGAGVLQPREAVMWALERRR